MARATQNPTLRRIEAVAQAAADSLGAAERNLNSQVARDLPSVPFAHQQVLTAEDKLDGVTWLAHKLGYACHCELVERNSTARKCKCTKMKRIPPLREGGIV